MNADNLIHIVLPLIDPFDERTAFPVARTMARTLCAPLHIVLASGLQAATKQDLARQMSVPLKELDAADFEEASGDPVNAVIHRVNASEHAMVVLAVPLRDKLPGNGLNPSNAIRRHVLEKIACPILIVPQGRDMTAWRLEKALLPQDGTPGCACALDEIINRSRQIGVENLILHIAGAKINQPTEPGSLATPRYVDHPHYEWEAWRREFLHRIFGTGSDLNAVGLRLLISTGEPAAEILRVAKEEAVDMIVMPWHGVLDSGRACMIKGVLHEATTPVLLVPDRGDRRSIKH